jgi:hypothetical protein
MTEFIKGMSVTALENVELVEVVNVPYNIDPQEFNRKAREFVENNPEIIEAAIKKAK